MKVNACKNQHQLLMSPIRKELRRAKKGHLQRTRIEKCKIDSVIKSDLIQKTYQFTVYGSKNSALYMIPSPPRYPCQDFLTPHFLPCTGTEFATILIPIHLTAHPHLPSPLPPGHVPLAAGHILCPSVLLCVAFLCQERYHVGYPCSVQEGGPRCACVFVLLCRWVINCPHMHRLGEAVSLHNLGGCALK